MSYRDLRRFRGTTPFLTAQAVSFLGDNSMWMACSIWVKSLTHSNGAAGLTFFFYLLPALLNSVAGLIADRAQHRPFLIGLNIAGCLILLPLFAVHSINDVWIIYLVMALYGTIGILAGPAQSAALTEILPKTQLSSANGLLRSMQETLRVLSPLLGAGIFEWFGGQAVALLDIATFLAAAALMLKVPIRTSAVVRSTHSIRSDLLEGFTFSARTPAIKFATVGCMIFMLSAGIGESVRWAVVSNGLHEGPGFVSIYQVAMGIGAVIGGLVSSTIVEHYGELRAMAIGFAIFSLGAGIQAVPSILPVLLGSGLMGAASPLAVVAALTLVQRTTPSHLQGRVFSSFELATIIPQLASIAIGAILVGLISYQALLAAMVAIGLCSALLPEILAKRTQA